MSIEKENGSSDGMLCRFLMGSNDCLKKIDIGRVEPARSVTWKTDLVFMLFPLTSTRKEGNTGGRGETKGF